MCIYMYADASNNRIGSTTQPKLHLHTMEDYKYLKAIYFCICGNLWWGTVTVYSREICTVIIVALRGRATSLDPGY